MDVSPRLFSLPDAAKYLAFSERHLRRLVSEKRIPVIKERKLLRFDIRDLDAWIDASRRDVLGPGEW